MVPKPPTPTAPTQMANPLQEELDRLKLAFSELSMAHEKLQVAHSELLANHEVIKGQIPKSSTTVDLPPIGSKVTFVNHAGVHEAATVTGHGNLGVHIDVQGSHPNDKFKRQEVP